MAEWYLRARERGSAIAVAFFLVSCGGGDSSAPSLQSGFVSVRPVDASDLEIAQSLYADNHRTPADFYSEPATTLPGYVATAHLKNTDLPGTSSVTQYELCSDDWTSALAWSDQVAIAASDSSLTDTTTTASYYEFGRMRAGTPQGFIRSRVYRCSYLNRNSVDLHTQNGAAGQFNLRPIAAADLQRLAEYLWQFTSYNNYGNAVFKSSGSMTSTGLSHTLVIGSLNGVAGKDCDHVSVIGWTHTVNAQSGELHLDTQSLWDFGVRRVAGVVELCNPF